MIISKLQGGLANQIFQWAFGRSLSEKYNIPLFLDINFYNNQVGITKREFSLSKFPNLKYEINIPNIGQIYRISDDFIFREYILSNSDSYYLDGYWQSEKYFKGIEDIIRKELSPTDDIKNRLKSNLTDSKSVSLHVRRTDYITSNGFHPLQTIKYYEEALNIIGDYDNLFIFSDDIEWCRNNLNFDKSVFMDGFTDIEDIWMMSMCDNNIIANSSFSWWGAWLNNNPNKKVVAPLNWFGHHANLNTSDIIPDNWIKI